MCTPVPRIDPTHDDPIIIDQTTPANAILNSECGREETRLHLLAALAAGALGAGGLLGEQV